MLNSKTTIHLLTISFCAAINVGIGFLVQAIKLPIYLDSIGTILATAFIGPVAGVITGVLGLAVLSILTAPTAFAYTITAVVIVYATFLFLKLGYLRNWVSTIIFGMLLGVIAAFVSAPITTYLFGGVSLAGSDIITVFFRATGKTLLNSVILGGISTDPVDKLLTSIICYSLIMGLPQKIKDVFPNSILFK